METFVVFFKSTVRTDDFLTMPHSAQALYFMLGIHADKNGNCELPKAITKMIGASEEDLDLLKDLGFVQDTNDRDGAVHIIGALEEDR